MCIKQKYTAIRKEILSIEREREREKDLSSRLSKMDLMSREKVAGIWREREREEVYTCVDERESGLYERFVYFRT